MNQSHAHTCAKRRPRSILAAPTGEKRGSICKFGRSAASDELPPTSHASSLSPVKKDLVLGDRLAWIHRTGERSGPWTHAYDMGTVVPALVKGKLDHSSVLVFFSIVQVFTKVVSCQSARYKRHEALYRHGSHYL